MSILINGMEMPECCDECVFMETQDSGFGNDYICGISKKDVDDVCDCPLIEVPPHGRLIDADVLMLQVQEYIEEYGLDVDEHGFHSEKWCAMKETEMAINDAPTVIPADKDGET